MKDFVFGNGELVVDVVEGDHGGSSVIVRKAKKKGLCGTLVDPIEYKEPLDENMVVLKFPSMWQGHRIADIMCTPNPKLLGN